jgi:two-component system copper resistance phosphate regulon response regulator CusR
MQILIVEDEPAVSSLLKRTLEDEGYKISVAMDGNIAWELIGRFNYNLFIFDLMLPGINGIELSKRCRKNKINTPILMLTALGTTDNIVMGLDSGADDYLTKPFKIAELLARIRTLLRRGNLVNETESGSLNTIYFADIVMNLDEKTVKRNNIQVELTVTEFRLMEYFLRNPKKVLSRMDILEKVWGYDFNINTKVVDVYINYLRKKIEINSTPKLIHTVVGMGYILKEE